MKIVSLLLCAAALLNAQQMPRRAPGFCLADTTGQWRDLAEDFGFAPLSSSPRTRGSS